VTVSSSLTATPQSNLNDILTSSLGNVDTSGVIDTGMSLIDQASVADAVINPDSSDYYLSADTGATDYMTAEYG
jgi:hypothetical protein